MLGLFGRAQRPAQGEPLENAVGPTSSVKGTLRSDGGVRIDGAFDGTIEVAGNVVVGPEGRVTGNITARNVIVGGIVNGDIDGTGQLQILSTGKVFGDIAVASVMIDDGGVFQGASRMRGLDQPALAPPRDEPGDERPRSSAQPAADERTVEATARLADDKPAATAEGAEVRGVDVATVEGTSWAAAPMEASAVPAEPAGKGAAERQEPTYDDLDLDLDLDAMGIEPVIPEIVIEDLTDEVTTPQPEGGTPATSRRGRTSRRTNKRAGQG